MSLVWKAVINEVVQMRNIIKNGKFYELVEKYLVNKPAILAYSSAAKYKGLTYCEYVKKIEVYVEDFLPELDGSKFEQIKLDSFESIDYDEDEKSIKCLTEKYVIHDLIKKCSDLEMKNVYVGNVGEELCEAIESYDVKHRYFPVYNDLTTEQEDCFNYYKELIDKLRNSD